MLAVIIYYYPVNVSYYNYSLNIYYWFCEFAMLYSRIKMEVKIDTALALTEFIV